MTRNRTFTNVAFALALVVALGGTSYAAGQITGADVKNSSLTTKDVKNRSLLEKDFKQGQLPSGPQGPIGPSSAHGTSGAVTPVSGTAQRTLSLPAGKYAVFASASASNEGIARSVTCDLRRVSPGLSIDDDSVSLPNGTSPSMGVQLALQGRIELSSAATLTLSCNGGSAEGLDYDDLDITAIQVGALP